VINLLKIGGKKTLTKSVHFWVILVLMLILMAIYRAWPWRPWQFEVGTWQWFSWLSGLYSLAKFELNYRIIGILFIIPIIYVALLFTWKGALIVSLLAIGSVLLTAIPIFSTNILITNIVLLMTPLLIVLFFTLEQSWRRREKSIFTEREEDRKLYLSRLIESQENERRRIAQDLHDDTIQNLLAISIYARNIASTMEYDVKEITKNAEQINDITLQTVEDLRRLTFNLRPSILDNLGLLPALRWLADRLQEESHIRTRFYCTGEERKLSPKVELAIFRVVQEVISNIKLHSKAREAIISLKFGSSSLKATIKDDGQGFKVPRRYHLLATTGKLGIVGITERIESVGGSLKIYSKPDRGTTISFEVKY
jgi:two-component system, NarL family, sensor histidine kinase DegS